MRWRRLIGSTGSLAREPAVAHDAHKVLRRQRVVQRHGEVERVLVLRELPLEHEGLVVQHALAVDVLDDHPEELGVVVHLGVELEVGRDRELHLEHRARHRLHVRRELRGRSRS